MVFIQRVGKENENPRRKSAKTKTLNGVKVRKINQNQEDDVRTEWETIPKLEQSVEGESLIEIKVDRKIETR